MKNSDSWLEVRNIFSQQLVVYKTGGLEVNEILARLDFLLSENIDMDKACQNEVESLIVSEKLPNDVEKQLLSRINDQRTRIDQNINTDSLLEKSSEADTESISENSMSSLLKGFLISGDGVQPIAIEPGQTIRSTYCIDSKIGGGGMGDVWKAVDLIQDAGDASDKYVAIKFINKEIRSHPYALKALVREFGRYKKLIHPNIVKAYELNRDNDRLFIVMEYLDGIELKQFIKQHPNGVSLQQAQPIIKAMCDALEHAHKEGIVHLDFKPGNVFYNPKSKICKVIDFGIARLSDPEERDKTRFDPGSLGAMTTAYASGEMLMELGPDPRDDIYGLACVIYELLSGHHPFNKKTALKAKREKIKAESIPNLSKAEFQAIQRGLVFDRANRTASTQKLYSELFEPHQQTKQKQTKWIVIVALLGGLSFGLYKGYGSWQLNNIKTAIEEQTIAGTELALLSIEEQKEILLSQGFRLALVRNVSEITAAEDTFSLLGKFDPDIQKIIFADRYAREHLISFYQNKVELAIKSDAFIEAEWLAHRIVQQYPDSLQLVKLSQSIQQQKTSRQTSLRHYYHQCVKDKTKFLTVLFPCLQEARADLRKIDVSEIILTVKNSGLTDRYTEEISAAIKKNELELAETLITQWGTLEGEAIAVRTELSEELAYSNKVDRLIKKISENKDGTQLEGILTSLSTQVAVFKKEILSNTLVKQRLIDYYTQTINQSLDNSKFSFALQGVTEGMVLLSGAKEQKVLKRLKLKVAARKIAYLNDLMKRYEQQLLKTQPDIIIIQRIQDDAASVAPENSIVRLPKLTKYYSKKIDTAIFNEQFDLAERLLNDWKVLKPSILGKEIFARLVDKKIKFQLALQNKKILVEQLDIAIQDSQLEKVTALIIEVRKKLLQKDQEKIIIDKQEALLSIYQQHIDSAIKQDKFSLAINVYTQMKQVFPKDRKLLKKKNIILKAKASRIKEILKKSQQAMNSADLKAVEIFSPLYKINTIDSDYFNSRFTVFNDLSNILIQKMNRESPLIQLQTVIAEWNAYIDSSTDIPKGVRGLFIKTKNKIALKCWYIGRQLKAQNQKMKANELFMFGLSLDPGKSVSSALEKELF